MKAIIFAAGIGKRLQTISQGRPKCLVELDGRSLLSRHLEHLERQGIGSLVIIVGYEQDALRDAVQRDGHFSGDVRFVVNEQYCRGSITSLWAARDEMDEDILLMDADVLYGHEILARLLSSESRTALLMDETVRQDSEECMVAVKDRRVTRLSKRVPVNFDEIGEGVGFLKVHQQDVPYLIQSVQRKVEDQQLDIEYEDALQEFFERVPVGYEKIGGLPWVEIDFPEDVDRAVTQVLPAIKALERHVSAKDSQG